MGEQIAVVPAVRAWGASVGAGAADLGGAVMAKRQRTKSDVLRIVRAYMRRQDLWNECNRKSLILQILSDEAVRRFVDGNLISHVDASMASDFKVSAEWAARRALKEVRS